MEGKSWELGYLEEIDVEIFDSGMADPFSDTDDLDKRNLIEEMRKKLREVNSENTVAARIKLMPPQCWSSLQRTSCTGPQTEFLQSEVIDQHNIGVRRKYLSI